MDFNLRLFIEPFTGFIVCFICYLILKKIINYNIENDKHPAISIFLKSIKSLLLSLPWVIFLLIQLRSFCEIYFSEYLSNILLFKKIIWLIYPNLMIWNISLDIKSLLKTTKTRWAKNISPLTIARIIQLMVIVTTVFGFAQLFDHSLSGFLALGGIGGIILGLAAREWLANFFGGLMLMVDRPFSEGDWIKSPDKQLEGHVEKVGWRLTRIRTFDRRPIYVPNSIFNGIIIENPTRMRNRRMIENFGLCYKDIEKLPKIFDKITAYILSADDIDITEPYYVKFMRYDDSSLLCQIRVHITKTDRIGFLSVQEKTLLAIAKIVKEENADFAFPTRTVITNNQQDI
jgi:MscS family membrane protein